MKKVDQIIRKSIPFVRLYFDDLQNIINILKDSGFEDVSIETLTHRYDDNELRDIPDGAQIFSIQSKQDSCVFISINFNSRSIYASTDSALAEGVLQKIRVVLYKRKRRFFSLFANKFLWLIILLSFLLLYIVLFSLNIVGYNNNVYLLISIIFLFFYSLSLFMEDGELMKANIFYLKNKNQLPNFWQRNKDTIFVKIIEYCIAFVLGLFMQWWLQIFK